MTAMVLEVARRQLAQVGPAALSLRAIAREIGVVPSALYRYFPGRDAILTSLISTAYEDLAAAAETAEAKVEQADLLGRWCAVWSGCRRWALDHPHEYALLYGTPVQDYRAPEDTVVPGTRVIAALARILADSPLAPIPGYPQPNDTLHADAEAVIAAMPALDMPVGAGTGVDHVLAVIEAWTTLFGAISFELFGQYRNSIEHPADYLDHLARLTAQRVGLPPR